MGGVGFSLSQPVAAQSEDIYTDPIDSLPKNVTQRIYNHMSGNRLLGHKPPGKTQHNRLSGRKSFGYTIIIINLYYYVRK